MCGNQSLCIWNHTCIYVYDSIYRVCFLKIKGRKYIAGEYISRNELSLSHLDPHSKEI